MTPQQIEIAIAKAHEDGYQEGLYDGLMEAHKNSDGRIAAPTKRVVATGRITEKGIQLDAVCDWPGMADGMELDATLESFLMGQRYGG